MAGRKSLAEDLADLINPMAKDLDPEAQEPGTGVVLPGHDDQIDTLASDVGRSRNGRLQMRAGIQLDDEAYRGRKSSRNSLFADVDGMNEGPANGLANGGPGSGRAAASEGALGLPGRRSPGALNGVGRKRPDRPSDDDDENEAEEGEDEEDEEEGGEWGEGEEGLHGDEQETQDGQGMTEEDEGTEEGEEGEEGSEKGEGELPFANGGDDDGELAGLEAGYRQLRAAEDQAVGALRERGRRDVVKGRAARQQQVLYERMLETRILLQKALAGSNRLPFSATTAHVIQLTDMTAPPASQQQALAAGEVLAGLGQRLQDLGQAAAVTLGELMGLHDALVGCTQSLCHGLVESCPPSNGTLDGHWAALSKRYEAFAPFRDASLDRWHARAVLTSGSATLQGSLKALNQSISKQVAAMMRDPHKLIQRCLVLCGTGAAPRLGEPNPSTDHPDDDNGLDGEQTLSRVGGDRDVESFDDGEFYQQLLKEFLEQGGAGGAGVSAARAAKKRKVVDRRASKGRKVRYNVQDKLVNFMSAAYMEPPVFADQLFANLFASGGSKP